MIQATINFKTISANIKKLKKQLLPHVKICAVVKANAYSLGDTTISRELEPHVHCFAVANLREAIRLRENGISKPILLFGPCENINQAISNDLIISIHNLSELKSLSKSLKNKNTKVRIHIKVNTGMNRYGITNVWQLKSILKTASQNNKIIVDGLYTQMSFEDNNTAELDAQLKKFTPFKTAIRIHHPHAIIHAACSGSAHYLPAQYDMVRIGKLLFGGFDGYRTALTVTSKISAIQHLPSGARVGYQGTYKTPSPLTCAIVPCGYADIAHFAFSNTNFVLVDNTPCKILGRVCMDTLMIDTTNIQEPIIGKKVTIIADQKGISLMEICSRCNIIACDLLCSLNFQRCELTYKH